MRKKLERKKRKRRSVLMLISVLIVGVIIATVLLNRLQPQQSQESPKELAENYFGIINATVNYGEFGPNESVLIIEQLGFTLKAVGGDAHDVIIQSTAMSEPVELVQLLENQTVYIELYYQYGYMSKRTEEGFPVDIKIWSQEAEGTITTVLEY